MENLVKYILNVKYDETDTKNIKLTLSTTLVALVGVVALVFSLINMIFNYNDLVFKLSIYSLILLFIIIYLLRRKKNVPLSAAVLYVFFSIFAPYSYYQVTPDLHLQYRSIIIAIVIFYLFEGLVAVCLSSIYGIILILIQFKFQPLDNNLFSYFFIAYVAVVFVMYLKDALTVYIEGAMSKKFHVATSRDNLTGALNRKGVTEKMENLYRREVPFSVIMLDIDNFKEVNDRLGHQVGDKYIIRLAEVISRYASENVYLARYGGDEFTIVKVHDSESVSAFMSKILAELRELEDFPMSVSMGECSITGENEDLDTVLYHADEALYFSKSNGKGIFTLYEDISKTRLSFSELSQQRVIDSYFDYSEKFKLPMIISDKNYNILRANSYFLEKTGYKDVADISTNCFMLLGLSQPIEEKRLLEEKVVTYDTIGVVNQLKVKLRRVALADNQNKIEYVLTTIIE